MLRLCCKFVHAKQVLKHKAQEQSWGKYHKKQMLVRGRQDCRLQGEQGPLGGALSLRSWRRRNTFALVPLHLRNIFKEYSPFASDSMKLVCQLDHPSMGNCC